MVASEYSDLVRALVQLTGACVVVGVELVRTNYLPRLSQRWKRSRRLVRRSLLAQGVFDETTEGQRRQLTGWVTLAATMAGYSTKASISELADAVADTFARAPIWQSPLRRTTAAGTASVGVAVASSCVEYPYRILTASLNLASLAFLFLGTLYATGALLVLALAPADTEPLLMGLAAIGNIGAAVITGWTAMMFRRVRASLGRVGIGAMGVALLITAWLGDGWPALPSSWRVALTVVLALAGVGGLGWACTASTSWVRPCRWFATTTGLALVALGLLTVADAALGYSHGASGMVLNVVGAFGWTVLGVGALVIGRFGGGETVGVGARDLPPAASGVRWQGPPFDRPMD